jgi:hypothetical protein
MIKTKLIIISLLFLSQTNWAQPKIDYCGVQAPADAWEKEFQQLIFAHKIKDPTQKQTSATYTIPIIFHIIHSGEPIGTFPNISQDQIIAQINVLNKDFSGNGFNSSNYPSNAFTNWVLQQMLPAANVDNIGRVKIADVGIQFCLATKDTNGNVLAEPGINRINYLPLNVPNPNSYSTQASMKSYLDNILKPRTIWNVTKYLNVWVTDKNSALSYTGVSSIPPLSGLMGIPNNATDSTDGIWCYTKVIGANSVYPNGIYGSPLVEGRTLTHEAGHYLGLRHIWGDAACASDYCDDTPPAAAQNIGGPAYPLNVGSCTSPTNAPEGEMFMNFMDYPWDPYKYMFTTDQAERMQTAMLNSPYRKWLGTHGLCSTSAAIDYNNGTPAIDIFPNPTQGPVTVHISNHELIGVAVKSLTGALLQEYFTSKFSIEDLPKGIYFITVTTRKSSLTSKIIKQ